MRRFVLALVCAAALSGPAVAEDAAGDWIGKVKIPSGEALTIAAHIRRDPSGALMGVAESPDQIVTPIPIADIAAAPDSLGFAIPGVGAAFKGRWDPAARGWVGVLVQGSVEMPLTLVRGVAPPRPVVAGLDGDWSGVLAAPTGDLRLRLSVRTDAEGTLALFQSLDQSPQQIVAHLTRTGDAVKFELRGVGGFEGRLSPDRKTLDGNWNQMGGSAPLTLKKAG
jgi:hypothetical protein